MLEEETNPFSY